jgi:hypothetical protein
MPTQVKGSSCPFPALSFVVEPVVSLFGSTNELDYRSEDQEGHNMLRGN